MDREEYLELITMNTGVPMTPVESSNIEGIGYNLKEHQLWVAFKNNRVYCYDSVPRYIFDKLMQAESKGKYHNQFIKNNYKYTAYEIQ